jgi:hypothetical protein
VFIGGVSSRSDALKEKEDDVKESNSGWREDWGWSQVMKERLFLGGIDISPSL